MERIKEQILNAKLEARRNKMRHECSLLIDLINEKVKKDKFESKIELENFVLDLDDELVNNNINFR